MSSNGEVEKAWALVSGGPEFRSQLSPSCTRGKLCNLFERQFPNMSNVDNNPYQGYCQY